MTAIADAAGAPRLRLVTGNSDKKREIERIVGRSLETVALDLPEIQSMDLTEVLRAKAAAGLEVAGSPLVVEEVGLEMAALGGFPGPLIKWLLEALGAEGLAGLAARLEEPAVLARCQVLWTDGDREVIGEGISRGRLVLPARGDTGFGWDPVFVPEGRERTCAELGDEIKDEIGHRGRAWRDLLSKLSAA